MLKIGCLAIFLIFVLNILLGGAVIMILWNWIAPIFWINAPLLDMYQGIGIWLSFWLIKSFFSKS